MEYLEIVLKSHVITHFSSSIKSGELWYCVGVVKRELWEKGENGVDYIPQVFEGMQLDSLLKEVISAFD